LYSITICDTNYRRRCQLWVWVSLNNGKWVSEREDEDLQGQFHPPINNVPPQGYSRWLYAFKAEPWRYLIFISGLPGRIVQQSCGAEDWKIPELGIFSVVAPEIEQDGWGIFRSTRLYSDTVNGTAISGSLT